MDPRTRSQVASILYLASLAAAYGLGLFVEITADDTAPRPAPVVAHYTVGLYQEEAEALGTNLTLDQVRTGHTPISAVGTSTATIYPGSNRTPTGGYIVIGPDGIRG